jgi:hypothetical protein
MGFFLANQSSLHWDKPSGGGTLPGLIRLERSAQNVWRRYDKKKACVPRFGNAGLEKFVSPAAAYLAAVVVIMLFFNSASSTANVVRMESPAWTMTRLFSVCVSPSRVISAFRS